MHDVLQRMLVSMELKGFAQSTKRNYLGHIKRFASFINKPLAEADYEDVRQFLFDSKHNRKLSGMFVDLNYSAIKFMFQYIFGRKWDMLVVPRLKRKLFLP